MSRRARQQGGAKDGYSSAVSKLLDFAMGDRARAQPAMRKLAGPEMVVDEWEQPLVLAYLAYGYADGKGERVIEAFLRERRGKLTSSEIAALEALRDTAWPSLLEVQEVELDEGIHFLDLVTRERFFARERAATRSLLKLDVVLGWMVRFDDTYEMTGAGITVPRGHVGVVEKELLQKMAQLRKGATVPDRVLLRQAIVPAQRRLRTAIANWQPPQIVTTDGEDIVFCGALFDVENDAAARAKLSSHPELEDDDGRFVWLDRKARKQPVDGPVCLGSITLERGRLRLETASRERLERGKHLIAGALGGLALHRMDSLEDVELSLAAALSRPPTKRRDELPEEEEAQMLAPILQRFVDTWIDERIPALGGKTPRQAVKTKTGRAKVISMLKNQESSMQRQPGGKMMDFSRVYRELGLEVGS